MDAPARRRLALAVLPLFAVGCSLFDRDTDRLVKDELRQPGPRPVNRQQTTSPTVQSFDTPDVPRGQAPEGPVRPAGPLPPGPVDPTPPQPTPAPITPLPTPNDPPPSFVVPAGGFGQPAVSRVKLVATIGLEYFVTDEEVLTQFRQRAKDYIALTGDERQAKEKEVYREELRKLIERELIVAEFVGRVKKNKAEMLPEIWADAAKMAERQIRELRRMNDLTNEEKFTQALQAMGLTYKDFKRNIERNAMTNMYLRELLKDKGKTISLAEIEDYYRRHADEFKVDDRVVWQHLFVAANQYKSAAEAKAFADWLHKSAVGGADVAKLAAEYGHGDSALRNGEGVGTKRGEILPQELEATVLATKKGAVSAVVPTATGYHIVKVTERDMAGVRPFDAKVQADVRNKLIDLAVKQERDRVVGELWRRSAVTVHVK